MQFCLQHDEGRGGRIAGIGTRFRAVSGGSENVAPWCQKDGEYGDCQHICQHIVNALTS